GVLLSSLVGSAASDQVAGNGVMALDDGNYVVFSRSWNGNRGAVTWGSGTTGVSGAGDTTNSLVGSNPNDRVRWVSSLSNGNYVVLSTRWTGNGGAVTWGDGTAGVSGVVGASNSLVGSSPNDRVGSQITTLSNGNYVVSSPSWNGQRGAVTWGSGTAGASGA